MSARRHAQGIGARMADRGITEPFPLYLRVVDATTQRVETGNYRDITRDGVVRVRRDAVVAARVLGLGRRQVDQHSTFLFDE